jgi:hypothetical protein
MRTHASLKVVRLTAKTGALTQANNNEEWRQWVMIRHVTVLWIAALIGISSTLTPALAFPVKPHRGGHVTRMKVSVLQASECASVGVPFQTGRQLLFKGDVEKALEAFRAAQHAAVRVNDPEWIVTCSLQVALLLLDRRLYKDAQPYMQRIAQERARLRPESLSPLDHYLKQQGKMFLGRGMQAAALRLARLQLGITDVTFGTDARTVAVRTRVAGENLLPRADASAAETYQKVLQLFISR